MILVNISQVPKSTRTSDKILWQLDRQGGARRLTFSEIKLSGIDLRWCKDWSEDISMRKRLLKEIQIIVATLQPSDYSSSKCLWASYFPPRN